MKQGGGKFCQSQTLLTKLTALQVNPFVKFGGLEFFGIFERAMGGAEFTDPQDEEGAFTQVAGELLYRQVCRSRI